jgi:hypothetical protein
MGKVFG